jgi:hypothetical protein
MRDETPVLPLYPESFPNFREWHEVPDGATIPAGTPFVYLHLLSDGTWAFFASEGARQNIEQDKGSSKLRRFTEKELSHPLDENDKSPRILSFTTGSRVEVMWLSKYDVWMVENSSHNKYGNLAKLMANNMLGKLEFKS